MPGSIAEGVKGGVEGGGVVTESIFTNMWAGGVKASEETVRMSYQKGKINASDLAMFQKAQFASHASSSSTVVLPPVPAEKRALEFKLAKLTAKMDKAVVRNDIAKASMYEKEAAKLRQQLQAWCQSQSSPPQTPAAETARAKLASLQDMSSESEKGTGATGSSKAQQRDIPAPQPETCGVGLRVASQRDVHTILAILPGSASAAADVKVGDIITSVDGKNISGLTLQELSGRLSGAQGSHVVLATVRNGRKQPPVSLERRPVTSVLKGLASDLHPQTWQREKEPSHRHSHSSENSNFPTHPLALPSLPKVEGKGKRRISVPHHDVGVVIGGGESEGNWDDQVSHLGGIRTEEIDVELGWGWSGGQEKDNSDADFASKWDGWGEEGEKETQLKEARTQRKLALALLESMNTARKLGSVPSGIDLPKKSDANAATLMGKLFKVKKKKGKHHREVDLLKFHTGQDLSQIQNLPAKTAKQVALERIRAALDEVEHQHVRRGRPRTSANAWSLDSDPDSDSELMNTSGARARERERGQNNDHARCCHVCCRSVATDMSGCWQDVVMIVKWCSKVESAESIYLSIPRSCFFSLSFSSLSPSLSRLLSFDVDLSDAIRSLPSAANHEMCRICVLCFVLWVSTLFSVCVCVYCVEIVFRGMYFP